MNIVKQYFQDYVKWFPEEWEWELADEESRKLYMEFRARKSSLYSNADKTPYFDSIEKDANQFGREHVEFTDIFGIRWVGKKGVHRYVGDADYDQHMYYWPEDDDEYVDEDTAVVSDDVTASKVPDGYAELNHHGVKHYIYMDGVEDIVYSYIVENHLFKDSCVDLSYNGQIDKSDIWKDSSDILRVWDIYGMAKALNKFKPDLYKKFIDCVDEHFKALQNSKRDEERAFAPTDNNGKFLSAAEYFDDIVKDQNPEKAFETIED